MNYWQRCLQYQITALRQHIFNYSKTRDVFRAYCQCKPKEKAKFAASHQAELDRHQAAKEAFNALGEQKLPTVKELSTEFEKLKQQKESCMPNTVQRKKNGQNCSPLRQISN